MADVEEKVRKDWEEHGIWVNQECFNGVWDRIWGWLHLDSIKDQMMKHGMVCDSDDIFLISDPQKRPRVRADNLLSEIVPKCGKFGYYLLYMCIRDAMGNRVGNADAVKELTTYANQKGLQPPWIANRTEIPADVVTDSKPYLLSSNILNTPDPASYWELQENCTYEGEGTTIAIIDTGIQMNHQSFASRQRNINFYQFAGDQSLSDSDTSGHGTFCAGVACGDLVEINMPDGSTVRCRGVAPKATLVVGKVIETNGSPWYGVQALQYLIQAIDQNNFKLDVVVLSSGSADQIPGLDEAIQALDQKGVIVVCAASNKGARDKAAIWYPARYRDTICIGSHDRHGNRSSFSPVGEDMDFLALGEDIIGPNLVDSLTQAYGTSFAAPAIGGLICLILQAVADKRPDKLKKIHTSNTMKKLLQKLTSEDSHNKQEGYGSIKQDQVKNFFSDPAHFVTRLEMDKSI